MGHDPTKAALRREMHSRYGIGADRVRYVRAPYRICPLGAHIDHQLGTVTAMAIDRGVLLAFAPAESKEVRVGSLAYPGEVRFNLDGIPPKQPGDWGNYTRGAATALTNARGLVRGILGITSGDLAEMGLSSSASIGLAYLLALEEANGLQVSAEENIRLDQAIENQYLGLNNGILDQTAILLSRANCLTVIDCKRFAESSERPSATPSPEEPTNSPTQAGAGFPPQGISLIAPPAPSLPFSILIAFSGVTQSIISTDYNRRVTECGEAAQLLLRAAGRSAAQARLAEVTPQEYEAHRAVLPSALARRAEHFFSEMKRVHLGVQAWRRGDWFEFGRLVSDSGRSSIQNYECGCPPMIDLYEILTRTTGVLGARFSGAGFRGCCVALVEPLTEAAILHEVQQAYSARRPEWADRARFFVCQSDDGARIL